MIATAGATTGGSLDVDRAGPSRRDRAWFQKNTKIIRASAVSLPLTDDQDATSTRGDLRTDKETNSEVETAASERHLCP